MDLLLAVHVILVLVVDNKYTEVFAMLYSPPLAFVQLTGFPCTETFNNIVLVLVDILK